MGPIFCRFSFSSIFLLFSLLFLFVVFFPPLLLFTVILNLPRHHYPLISPLPAPLPLSRGLVSESSCVHACTLARACVFNVHAFVLYTLHAYKYVYAYVLRTTNVGIVHLHTLPPAPPPVRPSPALPPHPSPGCLALQSICIQIYRASRWVVCLLANPRGNFYRLIYGLLFFGNTHRTRH